MSDDKIKDALKMIPYGFYSITSKSGEEVNAMVANWFTQISFEPRLVMVAIQKTSHSHKLIESGQVFAINIFDKANSEAIMPFTKGRAKNPDKMKGAEWSEGPETGCPIFDSAVAFLECRLAETHDVGGDHDLMVGEVVGAGVRRAGGASNTLSLLEIGWSYAG